MNILKIHSNEVEIDYADGKSLEFSLGDYLDIDKYISKEILPQINEEIDCILIESSLSENLLDFYGLRLICHIRLSNELKDKRFIPIILISDYDGCEISKMDSTGLSNVIFTKYVQVSSDDTVEISNAIKEIISNKNHYDNKEFLISFLNKIHLDAPKGRHNIANRWSIHLWAKYLDINTEIISDNNEVIDTMLYFKYLESLHALEEESSKYKIRRLENIQSKNKILYIDDEWDKGWSDILHKLFPSTDTFKFNTFKYTYKDKNKFTILADINKEIEKVDPDIVILDLRLIETDHSEEKNIDLLSGIKLTKRIREVNPGIQVIMLTATGQSVILEKLYNYKIFGYIKKEHPEDMRVNTRANIDKLFNLVNEGLKKKYLKEVWVIQNNIINLDSLKKVRLDFNGDNTLFELKNTVEMVFDILDSNVSKPYIYSMYTIFKCIELICDYYIDKDMKNIAYWKNNKKIVDYKRGDKSNNSVENKIVNILYNELNITNLDDTIKEIVCSRNYAIHAGEIKFHCKEYVKKSPDEKDIKKWFNMLCTILQKVK